jgi:hypothetical protein
MRAVKLSEADFPTGWVCRKDTWHFQRRLYERYGLILGRGEYRKIVLDIKEGRAVLLHAGRSS